MKQITTEAAAALIQSTKTGSGEGRMFRVTFNKRDGSSTTMRAKLGAQRNLKGKGLAYNPAEQGLMIVWSTDRNGYRALPLRRITALSLRDPVGHRRVSYAVA